MLLDSEEEHRVEQVVRFETDCSETHVDLLVVGLEGTADGLEGAHLDEMLRMSVGDVGM